MYWDIVELRVEKNWTIRVRCADGLTGSVRFEPDYFRGVMAPLADNQRFAGAFIDRGAVAWPGDIDLAPDTMHRQIRARGEWVLSSESVHAD
jgi:hypothetical protein